MNKKLIAVLCGLSLLVPIAGVQAQPVIAPTPPIPIEDSPTTEGESLATTEDILAALDADIANPDITVAQALQNAKDAGLSDTDASAALVASLVASGVSPAAAGSQALDAGADSTSVATAIAIATVTPTTVTTTGNADGTTTTTVTRVPAGTNPPPSTAAQFALFAAVGEINEASVLIVIDAINDGLSQEDITDIVDKYVSTN